MPPKVKTQSAHVTSYWACAMSRASRVRSAITFQNAVAVTLRISSTMPTKWKILYAAHVIGSAIATRVDGQGAIVSAVEHFVHRFGFTRGRTMANRLKPPAKTSPNLARFHRMEMDVVHAVDGLALQP